MVGNEDGWEGQEDAISNCPELHRRDLENRGDGEMPGEKGDEQSFHFSLLNDGDYWFI
jgi:hypothetical protein